MESVTVSKIILKRLPLYLGYLKSLPESTETVSATVMARALGMGDVQVRKDLAKVSHVGRRRTGRSRQRLIMDIEKHMDFAGKTGTVIVGAGKLGRALLDYGGFEESGLNIMAAFDIHPPAEESEKGKPIYPVNRLESFCKRYAVSVGIITVPAESAQGVCNRLVACGVQTIWNFAPVPLTVPEHIVMQSDSLSTLRMQLKPGDAHQ